MKINLRNYLDEDTVILHMIDTWPKEWIEFLDKNKSIIRKSRHLRYSSETLDEGSIDYSDVFYDIAHDLMSVIKYSNKTFLCYHASRYTKEEVDNIKTRGLNTSTSDSLNVRLDNLLTQKYITQKDKETIYNSSLLKDISRQDLLYFTLGFKNVCNNKHSTLREFYNNYGGEIVFGAIENTPLADQLNSLSMPYLVIAGVKTELIQEDCVLKIAVNILNSYDTKNFSKITSVINTMVDIKDIRDIVLVDDKTKLLKK